jgi:hypothetical protein
LLSVVPGAANLSSSAASVLQGLAAAGPALTAGLPSSGVIDRGLTLAPGSSALSRGNAASARAAAPIPVLPQVETQPFMGPVATSPNLTGQVALSVLAGINSPAIDGRNQPATAYGATLRADLAPILPGAGSPMLGGGPGAGGPGGGSSSSDSGSTTTSGSGDDGEGGTYSWTETDNWSYSSTSDGDGNSSYTDHTDSEYSYTDSGGSDGYSYNITESSYSTWDASGQSSSSNGSYSSSYTTETTSGDQGSTTSQYDGNSLDEGYDDTHVAHTDGGSSGSYGTTTAGGSSDAITWPSFGAGATPYAATGSSGGGGDDTSYSDYTSDDNGHDHFTLTYSAGGDTADQKYKDEYTDHTDGGSQTTGSTTTSHADSTSDDDGQENEDLDASSAAGSEDEGLFEEYKDHSEDHQTFDGTTSTDNSSYTNDADGNDHDNLNITDGVDTETDGFSDNYNQHREGSSSSDGSTTTSTSSFTDDDGGSDQGTLSLSDGRGGTDVSSYNDNYKDYDDGGTDADGLSHMSYTSDDGGGGSDQVNGSATGYTEDDGSSFDYTDDVSGSVDDSGDVTGTFSSTNDSKDHSQLNLSNQIETITEGFSDTASNQVSGGVGAGGVTAGFSESNGGSDNGEVTIHDSGDSIDDGYTDTYSETNAVAVGAGGGVTDSFSDTASGSDYGSEHLVPDNGASGPDIDQSFSDSYSFDGEDLNGAETDSFSETGDGPPGQGAGQNTPPTQAQIDKYNQDLLDYYHKIMQQILIVGGEINGGGIKNFYKNSPWYGTYNKINGNYPNGPGGLYTQVGPSAVKNYFPDNFEQLAQAIQYSMNNYKTIGGLGGIGLIDGSSYNMPFLPGINMSKEAFYGNEFGAISELVHEPQHNFGGGVLGTGFGHYRMRNIVPTVYPSDATYGGDALTLFYLFARSAKRADGVSLWTAILQEAGPPPVRPW